MPNILLNNREFSGRNSDPLTAVMLSLMPGLGQIYNGEKRKGFLFLEVAIINYFLLWLVVCTNPLVTCLRNIGTALNVRANGMLFAALQRTHWGSPLSLIIVGMVGLFAAYAMRDAWDRASYQRRKKLYPDQVIELTEATSGAYLFHFAAMATLFVLAAFFIVPEPPKTQLTEITFEEDQIPSKEQVKVDSIARQNQKDQGHHIPNRAVGVTASQSRPRHEEPHKLANEPAQRAERSMQPSHTVPIIKPAPPATTRNSAPQPTAPKIVTRNFPGPTPSSPTLTRTAAILPTPALPQATVTQRLSPPLPRVSDRQPNAAAPPLPTVQLQKAAGAAPVPSLPLLAMNSPLAPPLPVPGVGSGASIFQPTPLPVAPARAGSYGNPVPGLHTKSGADSAIPSIIAPVRIDNGSAHSNAMPVPVAGRTPGSSRNDTSTGGAPGPIRADNGSPAGRASGPALAVAPVAGRPGTSTGQPSGASALQPDSSSTGSPRENDRAGRDNAGARRDVDWGPYMAALQRRIKMNWFPPHGTESMRVMVSFTVHLNGELSHLSLKRSCGVAVADQAALKAVENSAPFAHLPPGVSEDADIEFTFDYNVFGGRRFM